MDISSVQRRALVSSMAAAVFAPGAARARTQTPPAPADSPADSLRYLDDAKRLTVKALLNGQGPFTFLVDTGANSSVIAAELAAQLGLPSAGQTRMHGIAGAQSVETVVADTLSVGRRVRRRTTLSVLPRDTLRVDGILGLEWLGGANLLLDFRRRRMLVGEGLPLPDQDTIAVKATVQKSGLTLIDAFVPGRRIVAFVDSGSTTTAGNLALLQAVQERGAIVGPLIETELRSVTGQVLPGRLVTISRLTLGNIVLRRVSMVIGPIHTFDFWGMHEEPAILIGSDILQAFESVAMDFHAGEVRFKVSGLSGNGAV
ncbi:aspartyl protease family protein [Caulobacter sp. 1776]|uniref:aspartyl protease family protein n=1 Tax=Caulobacter sp. 1776 TaxID=3156420 RepID=UPI00339455F4